jgi:hypothetical protein
MVVNGRIGLFGSWFVGIVILVSSTWAAVGVAAAAENAGRMERLLPADTLAFASVGDLPKVIDRWKDAGLRSPSANPALLAVARRVDELLPKSLRDKGLNWPEFLSLPTGEACMAVVPTKAGRPVVVIAMRVGDRQAKAEKFFAGLDQGGKKPVVQTIGEIQVHQTDAFTYFVREGVLVAATDPTTVQAMARSWPGAGGLLADKTYLAAMQRCNATGGSTEPDARFFVRPIEYVAAQINTIAKPKIGPAQFLAQSKRLGFDAIRAVAGVCRIGRDGRALDYRIAVLAPDQKTVAMRAFRFPNGPAETLPAWIPQEAAAVTCFSWDMQASFEPFVKLFDVAYADLTDEEGVFEQTLDSLANDPSGPRVDIRADFVRRLGKRVFVLVSGEKQGKAVADRSLVAIEINDEPAIAQSLEKYLKDAGGFNTPGNDPDEDDDDTLTFRKRTIAGHVVHQIEYRNAEPAAKKKAAQVRETNFRRNRPVVLTVAYGYLFWGSDVAMLERILKSGDSLAKDRSYKSVHGELDRLAGGPASFRSYSRCGDDFRLLARCMEPEDLLTSFFLEAPGRRPRTTQGQPPAQPSKASSATSGPGGWYARSLDDGWLIAGFVLKSGS